MSEIRNVAGQGSENEKTRKRERREYLQNPAHALLPGIMNHKSRITKHGHCQCESATRHIAYCVLRIVARSTSRVRFVCSNLELRNHIPRSSSGLSPQAAEPGNHGPWQSADRWQNHG